MQFDEIIYRVDSSSSLKKTPLMSFNGYAFQKDIRGYRFSDSGLLYRLVVKVPHRQRSSCIFNSDIILGNSEEKEG